MENNKKTSMIKEDNHLYSVVDMIINPEYRKKVYDHYDNIYEETEEEKDIFEAMNKRKLNLSKLKDKLSTKTISSEEVLKDVIPFNWSEEVLSGKKKVIVSKANNNKTEYTNNEREE